MAVKIGSARIDEHGKATGGAAGDQTGKEVSTQDWYLHSKGWTIIRANDASVREKIAYAMQRACDNQNIGYDQNQRYTAYDWCKYNNGGNYDPGAITAKVEVDCSSLVRLCCAYAGIFVGNFYTKNEVSVLKATGKFTIITDSRTKSSASLLRGDILVTCTKGHTVVVLSNGSNASTQTSTSTSSGNTSYSGKGIGTATALGSMNIRTGNGTNYQSLGTISKGTKVEVLEVCSNNWYKIVWPGASCGYAYTSNASNKYYSVVWANKASTTKMKATASLYIRKGPSTSYGIAGVLKAGEVIEVSGEENNWAKLADGRGYSSKKYLINV